MNYEENDTYCISEINLNAFQHTSKSETADGKNANVTGAEKPGERPESQERREQEDVNKARILRDEPTLTGSNKRGQWHPTSGGSSQVPLSTGTLCGSNRSHGRHP